MTTVLLTLDGSDESHVAALTATELFGPDATYLAVQADPDPPADQPVLWGPVFGFPYVAVPAAALTDPDQRHAAAQEARQRAAQQVAELDVAATAVGEVGDPVEAIQRVALERDADVIVVGAHERSWFRKLTDTSVSRNLIDAGQTPVLVVPPAP